MQQRIGKTIIIFILLFVMVPWGYGSNKQASTAPREAKKPTGAAVLVYRGADREKILKAGADKEQEIVWYTSLFGNVLSAIKEGFQKKYPTITVKEYNGNASVIVKRVTTELSARGSSADVLELNADGLMALKEAGLLETFWSPNLKNLNKEYLEESSDKGCIFVADRFSLVGFAYNTKLLPGNALPRTLQDLFNPQLKGKLVIPGGGLTTARFFAAMSKVIGENNMAKWKDMQYHIQQVDPPAVVDLIASGEEIASPVIFQSHAKQAEGKGAPVKWLALDTVVASAGSVAAVAKTAHPHAALLFIDYLTSPEVKKIFEQYGYPTPGSFKFKILQPEKGLTTSDYNVLIEKWQEFYRSNAGK